MEHPKSTRSRGDKAISVLLYSLLAATVLAIAIPAFIVATRKEPRSERLWKTSEHQLQAAHYNPGKVAAVFTRLQKGHPILAKELMRSNLRWEEELITHDLRLEVEVADGGAKLKVHAAITKRPRS